MAVDAHDLAPLDLRADPLHADRPRDELGDRTRLAARVVVELEDEQLVLPTVDAPVRSEICRDKLTSEFLPSRTGSTALLTMVITAGSEILAEALAAPVLASLTAAVERRLGQVARTPRAVAPGCVGVDARRRRRRRWRWRCLDITNPDADRRLRDAEALRDA